MAAAFTYDVFLSHSSKDKPVVRALAERLSSDGLRVWFDEWEIRPGNNIPAKIEQGLESSRLLVLCMSKHALGADWSALERQTFRFRDPLNKERRFIPLRLDDVVPTGSLAQFSYVDLRSEDLTAQYAKLLEAFRPADSHQTPEQQAARRRFEVKTFSLGHTNPVNSIAFSPDGRWALSGSSENTVRLWDVDAGRCRRVLEGHSASVWAVAWSPDGQLALSGSSDGAIRVWDVNSGRCIRVVEGHSSYVLSVAWSPDGRLALSGSHDHTIRLWDVDSGRCLRVLEGHASPVLSVAWSPFGWLALSGSNDRTVRFWDLENGERLHVLHGHAGKISSVAWSPDGRNAISGSSDNTARLWDVGSGRCLRILEGHTASILSVAWRPNGAHVLSSSSDTTIRLWDVFKGRSLRILEGHTDIVSSVAWSPDGRRALSASRDITLRLWEVNRGRCLNVLQGHTARIWGGAWSPDGRSALSGSDDSTVRLWEMDSGRCLRVLKGHTARTWSVAWSPDGRRALSGSADNTLRLWDLDSGHCLRVLEGHTASVLCVAWSPDGQYALSGSANNSLRLWAVDGGRSVRIFKGHTNDVFGVAWSPDGQYALSSSADNSVQLWQVDNGHCLRVFDGHTDSVLSVAWSPDGRHVLSCSADNTVRVWEVDSGRCLRVLEGHTSRVWSVAWSSDGRRALSGSDDNTVRVWEVDDGECLHVLQGHTASVVSVAWTMGSQAASSQAANGVMRLWNLQDGVELTPRSATRDAPFAAGPSADEHLQYTNAKVLLVGESGAGKTGLSMRLAQHSWKESDSTVGAWATHWKLPVATSGGLEREIWLWDFGGQADQRLIHQLYMDETALAVLVFDPQKDDLFDTLGQWDRDLTRAARRPFQKLLAAGRVDAGGLRVSRSKIEAFAEERGYVQCLETSAKTGQGCAELEQAIVDGIRWDDIPWRSSPRLFKRLKEEIIRLKDAGRVLMRLNELRETLQLKLANEGEHFTDEQLKAVVSLLAGPGVVWELKFGSWVLLQPERINAYAQAVIRTLRDDEHERGCILEEKVLRGELTYTSSMPRLPQDEERIVLLAMHQTLVERGLCLREHDPQGKRPTLLVFPSYYRRERPDLVGHPAVFVSYRFNGFLDDIYATLVVRLHHTEPFNQAELWRYAADFTTASGKRLGVKLTRRAEGAGELEVYFDPAISVDDKMVFSKYVHEHLLQKAQDVERLRHYVCPHCGTPVGNRTVAMKRLSDGKRDILCVSCENRVPLWDELEERFGSPEIQKKVRALQEQAKIVLDNESKERALVGDVISTVALAGQLSREFSVSDHGIDMEIEFKDDSGEATGKKLYLQLKSGDSYLKTRQRDDAEIFTLRDERHVRYWMAQAFPVLLVIRNSAGEVRWMEVRDWLKRESDDGRKKVTQLVFDGERFDVMSVRRWRDRVLAGGP